MMDQTTIHSTSNDVSDRLTIPTGIDSNHSQLEADAEEQLQQERETDSPSMTINNQKGTEYAKKGQRSSFFRFIRQMPRRLITNDESTKFALRLTTSFALASLFVLLPTKSSGNVDHDDDQRHGIPEPLWIVITAGVVSWQGSPDFASVAKKMIQRSMGTVLGAIIGLGVGSLSLLISKDHHGSIQQGLFVLGSLVVGTFSFAYFASRYGYRGHYSAILGCITFAIALLAFYDTNAAKDAWRVGVFRSVNICIGGILGGVASMLIYPVSTATLIEKKVSKLIKDTGETSRAVLLAAVSDPPPNLVFLARKQQTEDESHQRYMKCLIEWQKTRQLFDMLSYDPFFQGYSKEKQKLVWETFRLRLGRVLRIQVTLVMLDGLNRGRLHNVKETELLERIGTRLQTLLGSSEHPYNKLDIESAAKGLVDEDLPAVRQQTERACSSRRSFSSSCSDCDNEKENRVLMEDNSDNTEEDDDDSVVLQGEDLSLALNAFDELEMSNATAPKFFSSTQTSAHFFQLVEFLIVRSLRLERYRVRTDEKLRAVDSRK